MTDQPHRKESDPTQYDVMVVGSANMDLVVTCRQFPKPGETAFANSFEMYPGGKGANQAVACARLGSRVCFLARMGRDMFRDNLVASLESNGIVTENVIVDPDQPTGIALITVDETGQNEILVVSGANMALSPSDIDSRRAHFSDVAVVLLQLEIPLETVQRAARAGKDAGAIVVLNPAPARALPDSLYRSVDFLTPNETEAERLTGIRVTDRRGAEDAAAWFLEKGVQNVVFTLGSRGALLVNAAGSVDFPAFEVTARDTTAAGDAFCGALASGLARGEPIDQCIAFANSVAAFSVTRRGAQPSMPSLEEVHEFSNQPTFQSSS